MKVVFFILAVTAGASSLFFPDSPISTIAAIYFVGWAVLDKIDDMGKVRNNDPTN